jgi:adenylate cyclase class IV
LADELELKAVVTDPEVTRIRLDGAGAREMFVGMMRDRLFDRDAELSSRDEVLRVRLFEPQGGSPTAMVAWKGRTGRSPDGYKLRREIEFRCEDGVQALALFEALGYRRIRVIDRRVELLSVAGAVVRLEWYPRMDVLIEVEGPPAAIESAIRATGIPRDRFLAEPLVGFVTRYEARTGLRALLDESELAGAVPTWRTG